jgi:predicted HicB family RNase H-like nuclease
LPLTSLAAIAAYISSKSVTGTAAGGEGEPEATIYLRVPRTLKDWIEAKAKEAKVSLNSWVIRCVERCTDA